MPVEIAAGTFLEEPAVVPKALFPYASARTAAAGAAGDQDP